MGIAEFKPEPDKAIIEELEDILALARTGELTGISFLAELTGARVRTYHTSKDSVQVLGHLTRMIACANTALDQAITSAIGGR